MKSPRLPPALLALTPGVLRPAQFDAFLERVRAAVSAGLSGVLLREPGLSDRAFGELGQRLKVVLASSEREGWLGLHDRCHLARPLGAEGVHLGFRSLRPGEARTIVGADIAIGCSTHEGDARDHWKGAEYRVFGPFGEVPGKTHPRSPVGADGLRSQVREHSIPTWALGGVSPADVRSIVACGAHGVAVLSGILGIAEAAGVERATSAYLRALDTSFEGEGAA